MEERLLLKCDNTIYADEIANELESYGIIVRLHDETQDTAVGAYGGVTGIAIYVLDKDYDQAKGLISPIIKARNNAHPMCPNCGSENVAPLPYKHKYATGTAITSLALILLPIIYIAQPLELGLRSKMGDAIALVMVIVGLVLLFASRHINDNYECHDCNHKFHHIHIK